MPVYQTQRESRWYLRARAIAAWAPEPGVDEPHYYDELVERIFDAQRETYEESMKEAHRETAQVIGEIKATRAPVRLSVLPYRPTFWATAIIGLAAAVIQKFPTSWTGAFAAGVVAAGVLFNFYWSARVGRRPRDGAER